MSKFIYRMQSILDIKSKMEEQAKMDYAAARNVLNEEEEKLSYLSRRKSGYEDETRGLLADRLRVRRIMDAKNAVLVMDEFIAMQKIQVAIAERALEEARDKLTEVMKERKTHEKLKEKAFEEFKAEENAKESKEIDQLTSYTYGRRQREENGG